MGDDQEREGRALGRMLQKIRQRKRFSLGALGERSGVSKAYIAQIESGIDPRSGNAIKPSPPKLRALAEALAEGNQVEADAIYAQFMAAVGYLEGGSGLVNLGEGTEARQIPTPVQPAERESRLQPLAQTQPIRKSEAVMVELRDQRLYEHCRSVLEHWEQLGAEWQTAFLAFAEFVDAKRWSPRREVGP